MRRRRIIPALTCALALALPAGALAQGAGDNQYSDPFSGGNTPSQGSTGKSGGGSSHVNPQSTQSAQASPSSTPSAGSSQSGQSQGQTLPRTGFPAQLPLVYGLVMLLGGVALRRGARSRIR
jgi:hypothetical protein